MTKLALRPKLPAARRPLAVLAAAALISTSLGSAFAAGAYDTSDPEYQSRLEAAVAAGNIRQECLPTAATAPHADYVPIPEPTAELIAAAQAEGSLTINSGISDTMSISSYKAAFEARYPQIAVSVASGNSTNLQARLLADHASNNQQVDASITTQPGFLEEGYRAGALTPIDQIVPGILDTWPTGTWRWDTDGITTLVAFYRSLGIGYNTELVTGDLIPEDFADLARPEYKGQILAVDPAATQSFARVYKHLLGVVGEETMAAIGENMIKSPLYTDSQPAGQALGAGAGMLLLELGVNVGSTLARDGAPVGVVLPDSTTGTQYTFVVSSAAPHPNAAKLFAHWLYSAEGQWVTSCAAYAGSVAYQDQGSREFVPITTPVTDEEIANIKRILGI